MKKLLLVLALFSTSALAAETVCEAPNGTKHTIQSVDGYDDLVIDGTYYYISDKSYETDAENVTILDDNKYKNAIIIVDKKKQSLNDPKSTLVLVSPEGETISKCF